MMGSAVTEAQLNTAGETADTEDMRTRFRPAQATRSITKLTLATLIGLSGAACQSVESQTRKLPAYKAASALPGREAPLVFFRRSIDDSFPKLIPYAVIAAAGGSQQARFVEIRKRAAAEGADVVLFEEHEAQYAGAVNTYWGYGISTGQAVYTGVSSGLCCRLAKADLGIATNDDNMVLALSEGARESGLQEGDTLLSAGGLPWSRTQGSSLWRLELRLTPGDDVKLVWLRPGTGRMEGTGRAAQNRDRELVVAP